jgi:hypothetical protein
MLLQTPLEGHGRLSWWFDRDPVMPSRPNPVVPVTVMAYFPRGVVEVTATVAHQRLQANEAVAAYVQ